LNDVHGPDAGDLGGHVTATILGGPDDCPDRRFELRGARAGTGKGSGTSLATAPLIRVA